MNVSMLGGFLLLATSCVDGPVVQPDLTPGGDCWTGPDQPLEFELGAGEVWTGETTFTNRCDDVRAIRLASDDPRFDSAEPTVEAEPGQSVAVPLSFASDSPGEFSGNLSFLAGNGSSSQELSLAFSGTVYGPNLEITELNPAGVASAGCEYIREIELKNTGNMPLSISDIAVDSDRVRVRNGDGTRQVARGGTFVLELATESDVPSSIAATLSMTTNVVLQPTVTRSLSIETTYQNPISSSADLPVPKLDVLLVMDRSSCNMDHLRTMPEEVHHLRASLRGYDYRAMVVVADDGCVRGETKYIDDMTFADSTSTIMATMTDPEFDLAPYGANTERHFTLAKAALQASDGCNADVFRKDAFLHIIHQSDEPEQTPGPWQDQVEWFDTYTAGRVIHHAVAGPAPSGCASASTGWGFVEAVEETGGVFRSVCDYHPRTSRPIWDEHFDAFGAFMKQSSDYRVPLDPAALPGTVVLKVNGVEVTEGLDVSESGDLLTLSSATAPRGVSVQISYQAAPEDCR
ncbi:MAG: hypothetical protein AB8H79_19550 [Myxococcota bacterium]